MVDCVSELSGFRVQAMNPSTRHGRLLLVVQAAWYSGPSYPFPAPASIAAMTYIPGITVSVTAADEDMLARIVYRNPRKRVKARGLEVD